MSPQITYLIIAGVAFGLLVTDKLRVDLIGLLIILALALTGILSPEQAFSGFGSEPALVIAAIFVLSRALQLTGVADLVTGWILKLAGKSEKRVLAVVMTGVSAFSTFTEHVTPTAIMMPALLKLSRERQIPASKLLMPLSFAASLGSTIAIIGAPAFLFASTLLQKAGRPRLGLFSVAPIGIALSVIGIVYVLLLGRFLLPARQGKSASEDVFEGSTYLAEISIPPDSPLTAEGGKEFKDLGAKSVEIVQLMRGGKNLPQPAEARIQGGDKLIVRLPPDDLATLRQESEAVVLKPVEKFELPTPDSPGEEVTPRLAQAVVMPGSSLVGRTIGQSRLRRKYGVVLVAVSRQGEPDLEGIDKLKLRVGDVLVLEGEEEDIQQLNQDEASLLVAPFPGRPHKRANKRAALIMLAVILLASLNVAPLSVVALAGAVCMVLFGCLTANQAYEAVDARIFMFIAGAIPLGTAMEKTGLAAEAAHLLQGWIGNWPEFFVLLAIFAVAGLLTQVLSDTATMALMGPVAIAFAHAVGKPPEAYVLTAAFASIASFLTPIAHWGNLLVYAPGRYSFTDFVKVGTPLTVIVAIVVAFMGPMIFG